MIPFEKSHEISKFKFKKVCFMKKQISFLCEMKTNLLSSSKFLYLKRIKAV